MDFCSRDDGFDAVDLLGYAVDHRESAYHLYKASFRYHDSAAYLGHCSVEMCAKAVLLHVTGRFPKIHSLPKLFELAAQSGRAFARSLDEIVAKIDDAWDMRYPHRRPKQVGHSDRDALISLWHYLAEWIPQGLAEDYEAAEPHQKGGRILMVRHRSGQRPRANWDEPAGRAEE